MDFIKILLIAIGYCVVAPIGGFFVAQERYLKDFVCILLIFCLSLHVDTTVLMVDSIEWYRGVTKGYEFSIMEMLAITLIFATIFDPKTKFVFLPLGTLPWFLYVFASSLSVFQAIEVSYVFMNILKFAKIWLVVYAIANYVRSRHEVQTVLVGLCTMLIYQFFVVAKLKLIDGVYQNYGTFERSPCIHIWPHSPFWRLPCPPPLRLSYRFYILSPLLVQGLLFTQHSLVLHSRSWQWVSLQ